jgi:RIO-like serine/threonine protein kinase
MTFKITGHSGCLIELMEKDGNVFVRKSTQKSDYIERLVAQAEKQQKFGQITLPEGFDTPNIYKLHREHPAVYFDMAYINASDFISFFTYADIHNIHEICATILRWIDHHVQASIPAAFPLNVFLLKLQDVKARILLNPLVGEENITTLLQTFEKQLAQFSPKALLPQGICHGDMTFSNMLIHDPERITLIDMLDNFIETPLQDMVKLRQDTNFFWSLQFYHGDFSYVHIKSIMSYIDKKIDGHFRQYSFYLEYYSLFQILNYLRILPYAKDKHIIDHVINVLRKLLTR